MGKVGTLIKVAGVAGPTILKVVQSYGPQLRALAAENHDVIATIKRRIVQANRLSRQPITMTTIAERINALKDQVTYLYAAANTPQVAKKARRWRTQIDALENTLPLLGAMSKQAQKRELARVQQRIDKLSAAILAATISDDIADAELEEETED